MSLYVRVFTSFYSHRKTMRLRALLGNDAFWIPPRLWAYAADHQPDGNFSDYTADEVAGVIGYTGDASSMLQALLQAGFIDSDKKIHDWAVFNSYHQVYADRARRAALAKWEKERSRESSGNETEKKGEGKEQASLKHPSSTASSINKQSSGSAGASPATDSEWLRELAAKEVYSGLNVQHEFQKMVTWCEVNRKKPSRQRFVNWLNRIEKPMAAPSRKGPNI